MLSSTSLWTATDLGTNRTLRLISRTVSLTQLPLIWPSRLTVLPLTAENIGRLFRTRFKGSQFIVVSLKDGLFSNANGSS